MLKITPFLIFFSCSLVSAQVTLTEVDRQLLLDRLKKIQETTQDTAATRYTTALTAFKAAKSSDSAAHSLYIKCTEKILFEDEAKKSIEFREWRRRHKEREDSPAFRRALRHQLSWLVLTMEVGQDPKKWEANSSKITAALQAVLQDHEKLRGQEKILRENALASIFARAYGVNSLKASDFPKSPLEIGAIFEKIVFPPLRKIDRVSQLRKAWENRIGYEGNLIKEWSAEGSVRGRRPAFEKWYSSGRLDLLWAMELDVFKVGDQRAAALSMLEFLKKNLSHSKAPGWIAQFTQLIDGGEEEASKPETDQPETEAEKVEAE